MNYPFEFDNGSEGKTNEVYTARRQGGREGVTEAFLPRKNSDGPGMARIPAQSKGGAPGLVKPCIADTIKLNVYADNSFMLYVNGLLVAVGSIQFTPHNAVSVDFLPEYPITLAVLAKDNADPETGMEYGIGNGGFCLKFAGGTNRVSRCRDFGRLGVFSDTPCPPRKTSLPPCLPSDCRSRRSLRV